MESMTENKVKILGTEKVFSGGEGNSEGLAKGYRISTVR